MADKAYCPDDYGDSVLGETVQNGQLRQTVAQVGIPDATPASNHPANAAMALRDDIADNCLRKAPCPGSWALWDANRLWGSLLKAQAMLFHSRVVQHCVQGANFSNTIVVEGTKPAFLE